MDTQTIVKGLLGLALLAFSFQNIRSIIKHHQLIEMINDGISKIKTMKKDNQVFFVEMMLNSPISKIKEVSYYTKKTQSNKLGIYYDIALIVILLVGLAVVSTTKYANVYLLLVALFLFINNIKTIYTKLADTKKCQLIIKYLT